MPSHRSWLHGFLGAASIVAASPACAEDMPMRLSNDRAAPLVVDGGGSLQNPCFISASGDIVFTRWRGGYNDAPATMERTTSAGGAATVLTGIGAVSVNLPGACWHAERGIVFSTDEFDDRDEIYLRAPDGALTQLTNRPGLVAFEPSISPDGAWVVFESHVDDHEGDAALFKVRTDGSELTPLTDGAGDDRQPNWSPAGDLIVFQSHNRVPGNIELFTMDPQGESITNVTQSNAEDTDASFSADGLEIVYSSNEGELELANIFVIGVQGGTPRRVTFSTGYDGAPTWSPDGATILFESRLGDPDDSSGTMLYEVPAR